MKPWIVHRKENLFDTKWLQIFRERIETTRGYLIDYYTVVQGDVAMVLPLTDEDEILLIKEYKHGCKGFVWQLPAGKVEGDESPQEAAERELAEETGYKAETIELLGTWYICPPRMPDKIFLFASKGIHKIAKSKREDTEEMIMKLVRLNDAVKMVLNNEIKDAHSCIAILLWKGKI